MKLKRGSLRFDRYRDLRVRTLCDRKLKVAYFSRCSRDTELGINKMLFAASPISLKSKRIRAPAVRRGEAYTRHGLENAA